MSQLWWWCCCRFLFWGAQGPVSFRAVEGKGGQSALELSCCAGNGGESASGGCGGGSGASQLWSLVVVASPSSSVFVFGGGRGPVSFRGCEGGNVLSQLWSLVVVASPSSLSSSSCCLFLFWGGAGASQLPGL